ncbi:replication-relaxation family protein [Glycomyces arizonensis]|uniref:replication-relaxation family protein n=1 Tax=Glycomyces arizonensis TaxID=256035 RepID=UPI0004263F56|nr:replication-relaxation family protein [Glycomyces arizonensis]
MPELAYRLTDRDRAIIGDLGHLRVLTLEQIARVHFTSLSSARDRLTTLYELGVVDRFRPSNRSAYRYVLAWNGLRLHHAAVEEVRLALPEYLRGGGAKPRPQPSRPAAEALIARLIANPRRTHLEAVNDFYSRLAASVKAHPEIELLRWYGEAEATELMDASVLRPDGGALVDVSDEERVFWFEHDTGTETLAALVQKASWYNGATSWNKVIGRVDWRQALLLELTKPGREANLHAALAQSGFKFTIAMVTTGRSADPLDAIWQLVGKPLGHFLTLAQLPFIPRSRR